jgi:hypothetical protein
LDRRGSGLAARRPGGRFSMVQRRKYIREKSLTGYWRRKQPGWRPGPRSRLGSVYQAPFKKNQRKFISNNPPLFNFCLNLAQQNKLLLPLAHNCFFNCAELLYKHCRQYKFPDRRAKHAAGEHVMSREAGTNLVIRCPTQLSHG